MHLFSIVLLSSSLPSLIVFPLPLSALLLTFCLAFLTQTIKGQKNANASIGGIRGVKRIPNSCMLASLNWRVKYFLLPRNSKQNWSLSYHVLIWVSGHVILDAILLQNQAKEIKFFFLLIFLLVLLNRKCQNTFLLVVVVTIFLEEKEGDEFFSLHRYKYVV